MSSHTPWTRIPRMIDWNAVGDGSIFKSMPVDDQLTRSELFGDLDTGARRRTASPSSTA